MTAALPTIIQMAASRMLNAIPMGLLLAALAWLVSWRLGKHNARARFAVWFCALVGVAALPFAPALSTPGSGAGQAMAAAVTLPASWVAGILMLWTLFALGAILRVGAGFWRLRGLRQDAVPVHTAELPSELRAIVERGWQVRNVALCRSNEIRVPAAIGFFKPMVIIPGWAFDELSGEQLRVILLHEFAHLERWDDWTNLAQKLLRTIFFFHPAVWWIERRLTLEREMACDDAVLEQTLDRQTYAECLVSIAEKSLARRGWAMAQALLGRVHHTSLRVGRILDGRRSGKWVFKPALAAMMGLAALAIVVSPESPRWISFESTAAPLNVLAASTPAAHPVAIATTLNPPTSEPSTRRPKVAVTLAVQNRRPKKFPGYPPAVPVVAARALGPGQPASSRYVVVMQSSAYFSDGSTLVRFRVWQLIFTPNRRGGTVPKSL